MNISSNLSEIISVDQEELGLSLVGTQVFII